MKLNLVINGSAGRMGRRIAALAHESGDFEIVSALEAAGHPEIGKDIGVLAGIGDIGVVINTVFPEKADVMIDFSLPAATDKSINICVENGIALVMGTTGLGDDQLSKIKKASEKIAIIQATNMSVGMNLLFGLVGKMAGALGSDYDIEITEAHHRFKKDSPSGTALTLAENIAKETGRDFPDCLVHSRNGKETTREKGTIGMHAIRAGDIVGEHSVIFGTLGETITVSHSAHTRDTFVRGALRAGKWICGKKPGLYSMGDVLELK